MALIRVNALSCPSSSSDTPSSPESTGLLHGRPQTRQFLVDLGGFFYPRNNPVTIAIYHEMVIFFTNHNNWQIVTPISRAKIPYQLFSSLLLMAQSAYGWHEIDDHSLEGLEVIQSPYSYEETTQQLVSTMERLELDSNVNGFRPVRSRQIDAPANARTYELCKSSSTAGIMLGEKVIRHLIASHYGDIRYLSATNPCAVTIYETRNGEIRISYLNLDTINIQMDDSDLEIVEDELQSRNRVVSQLRNP